MTEIELSEAAEELLAGLWVAKEEEDEKVSVHSHAPTASRDEGAVRELREAGLVEDESGVLSMTDEGCRQAASIVRRERLAERLLADVLNVDESLAAETACEFEHVLRAGIDDQICTLLGHPRVCPHGRPIPPGECCREGSRAASKVVSALADLSPGQSGAIAYIHTRRREILHRLLSMGAVPGVQVRLIQKYPSFVFDLGQAQVAVDRQTAEHIYVRLRGQPAPPPPPWFRGPFPFRGFRFRRGRRGK